MRVDGILVKVDSLLGSDDAKGLVKEASDTLKSFKQVADTLNSRLGEITDGLARFSNQGLSDVERAGARQPPLDQPHRGGRHRSVAQPAAHPFRGRRNGARI